MATERQIAANKMNAKRSTGPRTPGGKAKASKNAMKHGILSQNLVILHENQEEFHELLDNLMAAHNPENQSELLLVEKMGIALWKQRRLISAEAAEIVSRQVSSKPLLLPTDQEARQDAIFRHQLALGLPVAAERYIRYDALLERQFYAALSMLQRVQAMRQQAREDALNAKAIDSPVSAPGIEAADEPVGNNGSTGANG